MSTAGVKVLVCPVSGTKGKPVKVETLRSLIRPEAQHRITEGPYLYCDAQGCDVVYFAQDGSHVFTRADLTVRVGVKETEAPRPICYCFGHTVEEIFDEIRRTGRTGVLDDIKTRLRTEGCDCEHTNPQGSCCLGVVTRFVQEGLKLYGAAAAHSQAPHPGDCCQPAAEAAADCCGTEPADDCCIPGPGATDCCTPSPGAGGSVPAPVAACCHRGHDPELLQQPVRIQGVGPVAAKSPGKGPDRRRSLHTRRL